MAYWDIHFWLVFGVVFLILTTYSIIMKFKNRSALLIIMDVPFIILFVLLFFLSLLHLLLDDMLF